MSSLRQETYNRFHTLLRPLAYVYARCMNLRRKAWGSGLFKSTKPSCPCISVGNIAWGGTGKTPLVAWLMQWALHHNLTPAVLSRGYKATLKNPPLHVQAHHTAQEVGDEPLMLHLACPKTLVKNTSSDTDEAKARLQEVAKAHVFVDPHRRRAAKYATDIVHPDLFILDDGMQHIALQRDLELIVLRPEDLSEQWNKVIPEGSWREGADTLAIADAFFIKVAPEDLDDLKPHILTRLSQFNRPVFTYHLVATGLEALNPQNTLDLRPQHAPYAFVAGIGAPKQATETVSDFMGTQPESIHTYPDHYNFTAADVQSFKQLAMPVICTSKDAARIRHMPIDFPLFSLNVAVEFGQALLTNDTFPAWLSAWWSKHTLSSHKDNS